MSDNASDEMPASRDRDWPELREWANFTVAAAALIVSVVSFWTTAQISGIEDYLRSEVALRNSELEEASLAARELDERVRMSTTRLEELRSNSERLSIAASEAQTRIASSQGLALDLLFKQQVTSGDLSAARSQLATVSEQIDRQKEILERYRREEVLSRAISKFGYLRYVDFWAGNADGARDIDGVFALNEMRNFGIEVRDPSVAS